MIEKLDLTGQKFGKLTVIGEAGRDKHGATVWECRCECGDTTVVTISNLRSGNTRSCGCIKRPTRKINLTGETFGRLTVIREAGRDEHGLVLWECRCECGDTTVVRTSNLRSGNTRSCGCYAIDCQNAARMKLPKPPL